MSSENIHPQFHRFVPPADKAALLGQNGFVVWMYGLSGSGKSTIAAEVERALHDAGRFVVILDGDNLRHSLNSDLGFSDDDRAENVRRVAEVAKLLASQGIIVLVSVITPKIVLRDLARRIIGETFLEVYIQASFETCAQRDPKGLYAKVNEGKITHFTGKDSGFEPPLKPDLILNTEALTINQAASQLLATIQNQISNPKESNPSPDH